MKSFLVLFAASPLLALALPQGGPQPNASDRFYAAIRANDLPTLRALIRETGVTAKDDAGNTPLIVASMVGSAESVRLLLDAGASPNEANATGATPLMMGAGDIEKTKLLLARGADPKVRSKQGRDALQIAAYYDSDGATVRILIERGADVNGKDAGGATPLEIAALSNNLAGAKLLIAHGADVNAADRMGMTPLISAAGNGDVNGPLVKLLVQHGANVNAKGAEIMGMVPRGNLDLGSLTPLHLAANCDPDAVRTLLAAGADTTAKDIRGGTPLVFAVATDHPKPETIKALSGRSGNAAMAAEWAARYNNSAVLPILGMKAKPTGAAKVPSAEESLPLIQSSLSRALAMSQKTAGEFMKNGGCFSCHSQIANGLAVWKAKKVGAPVDEPAERAVVETIAGGAGYFAGDVAQMIDPGGAYDTVASGLGHLAAAGVKPSFALDSFVHYLLASQRKEGDWPLSGIVRPPLQDGSFGGTARAIRALRAFPIPARAEETQGRITRAAKWLASHRPTTTEDRTMQILGLLWAGERPAEVRVRELAALQRKDGGWGQTSGLPSDAYATGEALVALREAGTKVSDPLYQRGVAFLLRTQEKDGTWHVASRALKFQPYFESGFPHGHDQWISQQGTAYAAMALADVLAEKPASSAASGLMRLKRP